MHSSYLRIVLVCLAAMSAAGCVQRAPYLESQMGQSLSIIKAQQVINPNAGSNTNQATSIDATAAMSAQERYHQSFKAPQPQPNAFTIGIGGGR